MKYIYHSFLCISNDKKEIQPAAQSASKQVSWKDEKNVKLFDPL